MLIIVSKLILNCESNNGKEKKEPSGHCEISPGFVDRSGDHWPMVRRCGAGAEHRCRAPRRDVPSGGCAALLSAVLLSTGPPVTA